MWKIDREEDFFKIFDSKKDVAGYFDPDFGEIFPKEKQYEIIEKMHKNHDKIKGGYLMVPMVKFGIFEPDREMELSYIQGQLESVEDRLSRWQEFMHLAKYPTHMIRISHTDSDMLSVTFPIKFPSPVPLEKNSILSEIESTLDLLHKQGLL